MLQTADPDSELAAQDRSAAALGRPAPHAWTPRVQRTLIARSFPCRLNFVPCQREKLPC
jgi:hypothetical protein